MTQSTEDAVKELKEAVDHLFEVKEAVQGMRKSLIAIDKHGRNIAFNTAFPVIQTIVLLLILWRVW